MSRAAGAQGSSGAAHQALVVFSLDHQRYALALGCVQRALRVVAITPLPRAPGIVMGIIDLGGEVIPVIDLRARFDHPPRALRLSDHLVIATTRRRSVALLVDETKGVISVGPEHCAPAGEGLPQTPFVVGAIKLEDGLVLIHDLELLLSPDEEDALECAIDAHATGSDQGGC